MKKTIIIAAMLLLGAARAGAQVDSSCLVLWQDSPLFPGPGYGWQNFDSVKVDICQGTEHLAEFAKMEFGVYFLYYIMPDSLAPVGDSLNLNWRDIDTSYPTIRAQFDSLEKRFGAFTIQHVNDFPDSSKYNGDTADDVKEWWVNFNTYLNIDTADYYLRKLPELNPHLGVYFEGRPLFYEGVKQNIPKSVIHIWPQPCISALHIQGWNIPDKIFSYDPLGRQISVPFTSTDGIVTLDVSNQPDGVLYIYASGRFLKILIQK